MIRKTINSLEYPKFNEVEILSYVQETNICRCALLERIEGEIVRNEHPYIFQNGGEPYFTLSEDEKQSLTIE